MRYLEASKLVKDVTKAFMEKEDQPDIARACCLGYFQAIITQAISYGDTQYLETRLTEKLEELLVEIIADE